MTSLFHTIASNVAAGLAGATLLVSGLFGHPAQPAQPAVAAQAPAAKGASMEIPATAAPAVPQAPGVVLGTSTDPVARAELDLRLSALRNDVAVLVSSVLAVTTSGTSLSAAASDAQYSAQIDAIHRSIARAGNSSNADLASASGILSVDHGGTGISSAPAYGQLLMGNGAGGYALVATSSLGISAGSSFDLAADHTFTGGNIFASATSTIFASTNATLTNATSTKLFSTNAVFTGATSTNLYATNLKAGTFAMDAALANGAKDLVDLNTWFSGTGGTGYNHLAAYSFTRSSDTMDYKGSNYGSVVRIDGNWGGAGMTGSRAALDISMIMQGTTSNTGNGSQYYVGIADYVYCGYNDNGTEGFTHVAGTCNSFNPIAQLGPNATNWYTLNPIEVDTRADPGSSSAHTFGILYSKRGVQGIYDDAAAAFEGTDPWKYILQIGKSDGGQSVSDASTTILGCVPDSFNTGCTAGYGIDLSDNWTWASTSKPFSSPGFSVNGLGGAFAASVTTPSIGTMGGVVSLTVGTTGSYAFIPTVNIAPPPSGGSQASAAVATMKLSQWTLGSGGTGYSVNDILTLTGGTCTSNPQVKVTSVSGGVITATTGYSSGLCSSPNFGTTTLTGGTGSGATLSGARYLVNTFTVTAAGNYSVAPTVTIQASGFGTATATATLGSTALTLTGGGGGSVVIDNNRIAVGTTTAYARLSVWGSDTASSTLAFNVINNASTTVFAVFNGGNAQLSGTLTQSSDRRLKTDIESLDASSTLALIDKLDPVAFTWKNRSQDGQQMGFIAQDVQKLFPTLVSTTSPTALTPNGTLGVNYIGLISPIIKAIQALSSKIDALAAAIAGLANRVTTRELCVEKSDGTPVCVTGDQLQGMLNSSGQQGTPYREPEQEPQPDTAATTTSSTSTSTSASEPDSAATTTSSTSTPEPDTAATTTSSTSASTSQPGSSQDTGESDAPSADTADGAGSASTTPAE